MVVKISEDQLQRFWMSDREEFVARLEKTIAEEAPWVAKVCPPKVFRSMINYAIDRATIANGFEMDVDVETFVSLMFTINPNFDQHPEIHNVLSNTSLPNEKRWDILTTDPKYEAIWEELDNPSNQAWSVEGRGSIEAAYPTTYTLPGFIRLYEKRRAEEYHYLAPGESLDDE